MDKSFQPSHSFAKLVPELLVTNLPASLRFWQDLLGFQVLYDRLEEGFAYLDRNGAQLMLEQRRSTARQWVTGNLRRPLGRGINFQIEYGPLEAVLTKLSDARWPLFMKPETIGYRVAGSEVRQRQFLVLDPDGYLLRVVNILGASMESGREMAR